MSDTRIHKLLKVLDFFHSWENQFATQKEQGQHLISRQTQEDIDCSIYGFIQIAHVATYLNILIIPGYLNSDLIENWFCPIRGL